MTASGARLVSLNPIRETLEDYFVKQVSTVDARALRAGFDAPTKASREPVDTRS